MRNPQRLSPVAGRRMSRTQAMRVRRDPSTAEIPAQCLKACESSLPLVRMTLTAPA